MSEEQARRTDEEKRPTKDAPAQRIDDLRDKLKTANQRNEDLKAKLEATRQVYSQVYGEFDAMRRSYYMSGAGQKTDIRALPEFGSIASAVIEDGRTGMHFDRLYTLWQAVMRAPSGLPVIEVGSYKGGSAKFIAEALRRAQPTPRFYVCDTFQGHARIDPEIDGEQAARGFTATSVESVAAYLAGYPFVELVVGDIAETSARLTDSAYGFVHIDVDVYPPTVFCLSHFAPRLAPGALMIVDDYGVVTCPGAQKAVDDFVHENPSFSRLHLLSGQAVLFRAG
jgi:predicted O-methyltransferase YrrM